MTDNSSWLVYRSVLEEGVTPRSRIAELTGLSLMTIGRITDRLEEEHILERDRRKQTGADLAGRRPALYRLSDRPFVMVADMAAKPHNVSLYDVAGHSVDVTLAGDVKGCAAEFYNEYHNDIALNVVIVPDGQTEPVGVFPWKAPDLVVSETTAAAWDAYNMALERTALYVGRTENSDWRACCVSDGKLGYIGHGGIRTLINVTGNIQSAVAALIVALSPGYVAIEAPDSKYLAFAENLRDVVPDAPEIMALTNKDNTHGSGAAMAALYRHLMSIKKLP